MTPSITIRAIECFEVSGIGMLTELQHFFDGLPSDTIVQSTNSHKKWRVTKRIFFNHTHGKQKVFANETPANLHFSFDRAANIEALAQAILDKEADNIYQYVLKPIGHTSKPPVGDTMELVTSEQ